VIEDVQRAVNIDFKGSCGGRVGSRVGEPD
jgi:hypothetical protein